MTVEVGLYALILALAVSGLTATLPLVGARTQNMALMGIARSGSLTLFALVALSFAILIRSYLLSDFSVRNVWENSHSLMPLIYK
ncbi:MAG: heme lyase NrfEFG subunit NrfE, partial [Rhizobiaceae bacterium]|nr:heme lyase NrfEFG subunit NrfE [Rhizobiaceae bacterium]